MMLGKQVCGRSYSTMTNILNSSMKLTIGCPSPIDPILALNRSTRLLDQTTITKVATLSQNQWNRPTYFIVNTH